MRAISFGFHCNIRETSKKTPDPGDSPVWPIALNPPSGGLGKM
jgi:hypothetical protein